jgi:hypothetical protein
MPKNPATSILNNIQEFKKNSENSSLEKKNSLVLKNSMVLNINNYIYFIMPNADLIQELMKQANLTEDQGNIVNDIFAQNFTPGGGAEDVIVNLIAEKLGVDKARATDIYAIGVTVLTTTGILDKIKGIFKR